MEPWVYSICNIASYITYIIMNQKQINRLEMFQATNSYLDDAPNAWSGIPVIATYKKDLTDVIEAIRASAGDQDAAQVFVSSSIRQLKRQLAERLDIFDDILEAYADDTDNSELLAQAANSKSDYYRLPNEDFETKAINTFSLLDQYLEAVGDYGLIREEVEEAKVSFGVFQDRVGKPRSYQVASRVATQSLEELIGQGSDILNRMDKVMKRFKRSNSGFYNGYLAARTIIDN